MRPARSSVSARLSRGSGSPGRVLRAQVEKLQTIPPTLGEYEYNGLHWRTVKRTDGDAERRMLYSASWQLLEERFDSDITDGSGVFAEEKCSQMVWGLRYIDDAVLRRTDTDQDYNYSDAGERTDYYLTDPQFSVVAVVDDTGALQERVAYSAYGEARHHYPADMNGDGDADSGDMSWFTNINNLKDIDEAGYNPDGDLNRDGSVDSGDVSIASGWNGSAALAKGLISDPDGPGNPIGYDGYVFNAETKIYTVRVRHYEPVTGRWVERDPLDYREGQSLVQFVRSSPALRVDPSGALSHQLDDDRSVPSDEERKANADDPSQGCGIRVRQQTYGPTNGHRWIEIYDPNLGRWVGMGYYPRGGGASDAIASRPGVWHTPYGDRLQSEIQDLDGSWTDPTHPTCYCVTDDDSHLGDKEWGREWSVKIVEKKYKGLVYWTMYGMANNILEHGMHVGTRAVDATCDQIRDCLYSYYPDKPYNATNAFGTNCRESVRSALGSCGLGRISTTSPVNNIGPVGIY
jgi:RHS repeat-associated protein